MYSEGENVCVYRCVARERERESVCVFMARERVCACVCFIRNRGRQTEKRM